MVNFKMAPRKKSTKTSRGSLNDILDKENNYLRSLSDYRTRVRRRESVKKNKEDDDLEGKIELEMKIKEGSSRLLAAAENTAQTLEAARALFTSNERMSSYRNELRHRGENISELNGKLSISDLRFPLMWRDRDHFKNRGDHRRFAVFCLARVAGEIQDTSLLYPVDREQTDMSFPDVFFFNKVAAEFELRLEIYSHMLQEDLTIASTPRRIRRSIHSSISKTVGRKFVASLRDRNDSRKAPQFDLAAYAKMSLDDTDENVRSYDLTLNSIENKARALPLFGQFCCRLTVQPNSIDKEEALAGFVIVNNRRYWARLLGFEIEAWKSKKLVEKLEKPSRTIPLNRETFIRRLKSTNNQLRIINNNSNKKNNNTDDIEKREDVMEFESKEDLERWIGQLSMRILRRRSTRGGNTSTAIQDILLPTVSDKDPPPYTITHH